MPQQAIGQKPILQCYWDKQEIVMCRKYKERQLSILHYYAQKLIATGCLFAQIAYKQDRGKTSTNKWYPRAITHIIHFNFIKVKKNKQSGKQNKEKPTFFNPFIIIA